MTIDTPERGMIPSLRGLWKEAFGDSEIFLDGFFSQGFAPERCRVLEWNGECAAALYWFDCSLEGQKLAYLYAVATQKRFQGKGFCRRLMEDTHAHLKRQGYSGCVLVPGNEGLFALYEKLGYRPCCAMERRTFMAVSAPLPLQAVTPAQYSLFRKALLPAGGAEQQGIEYLATFTRLYTGGDCLFSVAQEGDGAVFQEFLGDEKKIPRILGTLGAKRGMALLPGGGQPCAMYKSLSGRGAAPGYFGIHFN